MNTLAYTFAASGGQSLAGILISFLIVVLILACIGGLLWLIEKYISPIPPPVKVIFAIVLLILVIIWALKQFGVS